jgi:hypothetical protein
MNDTLFAVLILIGFAWGYGTARLNDYLGRKDDEKRNKDAIRRAYLRQRHVRLYGDEWGDNAGA